MSNIEIYNKVFVDTLGVKDSDLAGLEYLAVAGWDSLGHMSLIANLEDAFNIMMDTDDIIDFSSYEKGKEILAKYDVDF